MHGQQNIKFRSLYFLECKWELYHRTTRSVKISRGPKEIEVPGIRKRVHLIYILPKICIVCFHRAPNRHESMANNTSEQHANGTLQIQSTKATKQQGLGFTFRNMRQTISRFISALSPFSPLLFLFSPFVDYSKTFFQGDARLYCILWTRKWWMNKCGAQER